MLLRLQVFAKYLNTLSKYLLQHVDRFGSYKVLVFVVTGHASGPASALDDGHCSPQVGKKWRRADTNIVAIKFDQLKKPSTMHTGDPVSCQKCNAMMSHLSTVSEDGDEQVQPSLSIDNYLVHSFLPLSWKTPVKSLIFVLIVVVYLVDMWYNI